MPVVTMEFKSADVRRAVRQLQERAPRGILRALSRSATSAKAVMARDVAKDLGLKVGVVKDQIRLQEPNAMTMTARLVVRGARIPLMDFGARQTKRGVTAKVGATRKTYPGTFIATMGSGHRGVFARRGRKRLPITELHGPSLPHVFEKHLAAGIARGQEQLVKNLQHELRFALTSGT